MPRLGSGGACGIADPQYGRQHDVRRALDIASMQEQVDQRSASLLYRGGDGGERRMAKVRAENVVKADHAYVAGDVDPQVLQSLQQEGKYVGKVIQPRPPSPQDTPATSPGQPKASLQ